MLFGFLSEILYAILCPDNGVVVGNLHLGRRLVNDNARRNKLLHLIERAVLVVHPDNVAALLFEGKGRLVMIVRFV